MDGIPTTPPPLHQLLKIEVLEALLIYFVFASSLSKYPGYHRSWGTGKFFSLPSPQTHHCLLALLLLGISIRDPAQYRKSHDQLIPDLPFYNIGHTLTSLDCVILLLNPAENMNELSRLPPPPSLVKPFFLFE